MAIYVTESTALDSYALIIKFLLLINIQGHSGRMSFSTGSEEL
ncbi:hypothetical protein AJ78_06897 [Emergomyces pasteurianus Ep9510]|uniref:Uncharacterized protein n=1 Tax=Emergomyces pasteurianus Ep9510 TaxID=1447872 RepID=A0A1J9Q9E0_9EURO|nr:hypothetical protein AJ78_06897 [Emergomyces pasteurianus Ep9510]